MEADRRRRRVMATGPNNSKAACTSSVRQTQRDVCIVDFTAEPAGGMRQRQRCDTRLVIEQTSCLGVTLTELLVTVAIVAILAAIAAPTYVSQIQSARRVDAQTALVANAQFLQKVYTETGCFNPGRDRDCTPPNDDAGITLPIIESPVDGDRKYYDHALQELTRTGFTLTAGPKGAQRDDHCGLLGLDHLWRRTPAETRCWRR